MTTEDGTGQRSEFLKKKKKNRLTSTVSCDFMKHRNYNNAFLNKTLITQVRHSGAFEIEVFLLHTSLNLMLRKS
jgi:hypothetical protein